MRTSNKLKKYIKKEKIMDILEVVNYLYPNNDESYVRFLKKGSNNKEKAYNINSLKNKNKLFQIIKSFGTEDLFMSLNEFKTMERGTRSNLFCINAIAVDVDYKKVDDFKDLTPEQVINLLDLEKFNYSIPMPNLIEYGNQIRLIYKLRESVYVPKNRDNAIVLAGRISEVFANELKDFGAEKQNIESYIRVFGSINTKNQSEVKVIYLTEAVEYELRELQELWLDEIPKWFKKRKGKRKDKNKVVKLHNVYSLNSNRLLDFEKIQQYLNNNNINDFRARLNYIYRNYVLIKLKYQNGELLEEDYITAEKEMLKFNNKFNNPMRQNIIESATRSLNRKQYLYKNETLVQFLELDFELCEKLELKSIYKLKTKKEYDKENYQENKHKLKEKYIEKLKKEGKITKKEELKILRNKIKVLRAKGLFNREISEQLNIPLKSLERNISFMKKNGLL